MAKKEKFKGMTRAEKVEELKPREKKYKNVKEHMEDLNERFQMAIREGADPLGYMTIKEIYEDIKFLNQFKTMDLEE